MALTRWITTPAGKAAYAEDRHAALTEACKVTAAVRKEFEFVFLRHGVLRT